MQARFHVVYTTKTIAPQSLPPFPYQAVAVEFDRIRFAAEFEADDATNAARSLEDFWPDAVILTVEPTDDTMTPTPAIATSVYGSIPKPPPRPGLFYRIWRYLWGDLFYRTKR